MIVRVVRMFFEEDKINDFLSIFEESKERIRSFEGCEFLELLQDSKQANVFCTYSKWDSEQCLDNYRQSDFFISTWKRTKTLFREKPIAFSLQKFE